MQCPKCEYVAEPGEAKVEGQCPNCEVFYHKVRRPAGEQVATDVRAARYGAKRNLAFALIAVLLFAGACFYGFKQYAYYQLVKNVETVVRSTNGQLAELLDKRAGRTNADFLRIYQGRLDELDKLVAQALAIDDAANPGVSTAAADYVRTSQEFIRIFSDELQGRLLLSGEQASFQVASKFLDTEEGERFAAMSDAEVSALYSSNLEQISAANGFDERLAQLKRGSELEALGKKRIAYLQAKNSLERAKARHEEALLALGKAGESIGRAGGQLEARIGRKLPIQAWSLNP